MNKKLIVAGLALLVTAGVAIAATAYTNTVGGLSGYPLVNGSKVFVSENTLTLSTSVTYAATDTVAMINIPSNTFVQAVELVIPVATTNGTSTVDVGDKDSANRYISNANSEVVNGCTLSAASTWCVKMTNSELRLTFDHVPGHTGTFKVKAVIANLN